MEAKSTGPDPSLHLIPANLSFFKASGLPPTYMLPVLPPSTGMEVPFT